MFQGEHLMGGLNGILFFINGIIQGLLGLFGP